MNIEGCLCVLISLIFMIGVAILLEGLCSCYYPFLLSAQIYYRVKHPKLRSILIAPQRTASWDTQTAPEDRDKLPLCGCLFCMVVFPWLLCELVLVLGLLILCLLHTEPIASPAIQRLISVVEFLFLCPWIYYFAAGMPVLYMVDYSLGLRRHLK